MSRIIYFSSSYTPHDYRFLSVLAETDHEVFYLRLERSPRQTEDRPVPPKIEQVQWAGGQGLFNWRDLPRLTLNLRQVIRHIRPDLVHAGPIQTCAFLTVLAGFHPLLTMSWGFDLMQNADRNAWWKNITRYTLKRSTFFTSDAEVTRKKAIAYGMNPQRTVVFPWGVDLAHFAPSSTVHGPRSQGFTLFCNRSWEQRYGVDVLAKAFVNVAQQRADISLLLLGGGSQATTIRQIFERGGVVDRVMFTGQVSQADLPRYYQMADLYISPSHVDGSSVSLMEALACGLPCLVADIPANKEWVTEGVNGWLFPDGNVDALAASILRVYEHRQKLFKIGQTARQTAEEKADWKKNSAKLLDLYDLTVRSNA